MLYIADWFSKRESVVCFYAQILPKHMANIQSWAVEEVQHHLDDDRAGRTAAMAIQTMFALGE